MEELGGLGLETWPFLLWMYYYIVNSLEANSGCLGAKRQIRQTGTLKRKKIKLNLKKSYLKKRDKKRWWKAVAEIGVSCSCGLKWASRSLEKHRGLSITGCLRSLPISWALECQLIHLLHRHVLNEYRALSSIVFWLLSLASSFYWTTCYDLCFHFFIAR